MVGTKVYLFGGNTGSSRLKTINVFDTTSSAITTLSATLPKAAGGIVAAAVGTKVYLFGGYDGNPLNTINVFDTASNTITTLSATLPKATSGIATAMVDTKVYLFGGYDGGRLNTINVFGVTLPLAANNLLIGVGGANNLFNLLPNVELGVNAVYLGNVGGGGELVSAALYKDGAWVEI